MLPVDRLHSRQKSFSEVQYDLSDCDIVGGCNCKWPCIPFDVLIFGLTFQLYLVLTARTRAIPTTLTVALTYLGKYPQPNIRIFFYILLPQFVKIEGSHFPYWGEITIRPKRFVSIINIPRKLG